MNSDIQVLDLDYKNPNYQLLVQRKLKIKLERAKKLAALENSLTEKSLNAIKLHEEHLKERSEKVSNLGKSSLEIAKRAKEKEKMLVYNYIASQREKSLLKPQKIANTLNKPGITSWLGSASGGRIKAFYADLPLSTTNASLREWETLTGYLGAKKTISKSTSKIPLTENNNKRGYCYKLSPILRSLSYDHALKYLILRSKGKSKKEAIAISQKMRCNLNENEDNVRRKRLESHENYDDLEKRFENFIQKNHIKDGELVPKEIFNFPINFREKDINEIIKPTSNDKEKTKPILENAKVLLSGFLRKILEKKKKKNLEEKWSPSPVKKVNAEDDYSAYSNQQSQIKRNLSNNELNNKDIKNEIKPNENTFKIIAVRPSRYFLPTDKETKANIDPKVFTTQQSLRKIKSTEREKKNSQSNLPMIHTTEITKNIPVMKEEIDPIQLKNKKLLTESEKIRKKINEKIKKTKRKKDELQIQSILSLNKTLEDKKLKIKEISENKQKKKIEILKMHKNNSVEYFNKVKAMKERKITTILEESEFIRKNYEERFQKAEENRLEVLLEKERKMESQRNQYNSQRVFVELLQSLIPVIK